jgi:hypothetical protein
MARSRIVGTSRDDTLSSDLSRVEIIGRGGDDLLFATGGYVVLYGGDGDDTLHATGAYATLYGGQGRDLLRAEGPFSLLDGGAGDDVLESVSASPFGGGSGNSLLGGEGNDRLVVRGLDPGAGVDRGGFVVDADGGAGDDTLVMIGDWGLLASGSRVDADVFVLNGLHNAIRDFDVDGGDGGADRLDLRGLTDADAALASLTLAELVAGRYLGVEVEALAGGLQQTRVWFDADGRRGGPDPQTVVTLTGTVLGAGPGFEDHWIV